MKTNQALLSFSLFFLLLVSRIYASVEIAGHDDEATLLFWRDTHSTTIQPQTWQTFKIQVKADQVLELIITPLTKQNTELEVYGKFNSVPSNYEYDRHAFVRFGTNMFDDSVRSDGYYYVSFFNPDVVAVDYEVTLLLNDEWIYKWRGDYLLLALGSVIVLLGVALLYIISQRLKKKKESNQFVTNTQLLEEGKIALPTVPVFNKQPTPLVKLSTGPWSARYVPRNCETNEQ